MKKISLFSLFLMICLILIACSDSTSSDEPKFDNSSGYEIVVENKAKKTEQMEIRVTTNSSDEKEFEDITKGIIGKYENKGLDSIHLYFHNPDEEDTFGDLKAKSVIAYTQKGAAQVGLTKANSFEVEIEENINTGDSNSEDYSTEEWQDSFKNIAISQAEAYIELSERDGDLPADRLESYSGVVQQQADKLINNDLKQQVQTLAKLIQENKLDEVKNLVNQLK